LIICGDSRLAQLIAVQVGATLDDDELTRRAQIIANDYAGIFPMHLAFYARSILFAASRAIQAFGRFEESVAAADDSEAVSSLHEALTHSAALSRFFWPSGLGGKSRPVLKKLADARASRLRMLYALDEQSALRDRNLRDALEHFDERLDRYLLGLEAGYIFPDPMLGTIHLAQDPVGHIFKLVDPSERVFVLLGQSYSYGHLVPELRRIAQRAESEG